MTATLADPNWTTKHPAKFSPEVLKSLGRIIRQEANRQLDADPHLYEVVCLDPFAGVGRIHQIRARGLRTVGIEIEPEWAGCHADTLCADSIAWMHEHRMARVLQPAASGRIHIIGTSPGYGNRYSDCHDNQDGSERRSYKHDLGRMPTRGSSATLPWGPRYWAFHGRAYRAMFDALEGGGLLALNVSNFIRGKELVHAIEWHRGACYGAGFVQAPEYRTRYIGTRRMRNGQNWEARAEAEVILLFRKPLNSQWADTEPLADG